MEASYFLTRIDTNHQINVADTLITPLRWLVNGHRYKAIRVGQADAEEFSHAVAYQQSRPLINMVKRIIGFVGTVVFFPVVCLGLGLKALQISDISKENYAYVTSIQNDEKAKFLCKKAFSIAPKPIPMLSSKDKKVVETELGDLVELWNTAASAHLEARSISEKLRKWVTDVVPYPENYNYISQKAAPAAAEELQYYLKLIMIELQAKDHADTTEKVIIELVNASEKCSPTWLEVAKREYQKLKCGDLIDQQILQYLREVKEDLIMEYAETVEQGTQWHVINYARWIVGKEFGLDRSHLDYDSVITHEVLEGYTKQKCREVFYSIFKMDEIINRIQAKIELENAGTNVSIQFYGPTLASIADKHATSSGIDIEDEDYDSDTYYMETFFDLKGSHYILNTAGVEALLEMQGLLLNM